MNRTTAVAVLLLLAFVFPARAETPAKKPATVPFDLLKTKHMTVMVKINGKGPYRMIFDTGAPVTVISTKVAKEAKLLNEDGSAPSGGLFGPLGQVKVKTLELGELKADDTQAVVMDHPTVALMAKAFGALEGIIGFPFFARYETTIDYQAKQMTFTPSNYEPEDIIKNLMAAMLSPQRGPRVLSPAAQWGMEVTRGEGEEPGVTIKNVLPDSAAAKAGLKADDRLLTIDSRWTDTIADCYLAAGTIKAGETVPVTIKRDGKEMKLMVTPRSGL